MTMTTESDVAEVVDEVVDDLDVNRVAREAERLGLTAEKLLAHIMTEAWARMDGEVT
jgi:hypothetical protein